MSHLSFDQRSNKEQASRLSVDSDSLTEASLTCNQTGASQTATTCFEPQQPCAADTCLSLQLRARLLLQTQTKGSSMHPLAIQPPEVEIDINQTGQEVAVPVCIKVRQQFLVRHAHESIPLVTKWA